MVSARSTFLWLCAALAVAGCNGKPPTAGAASGGESAGDSAQESDLAPPRVELVQGGIGGVTLLGSAPAGGEVRLAQPTGQALLASVDTQGRWAIAVPPANEPRIFGLSVAVRGRRAQAEGYVLVTPTGQAALLRAGTSAVRLDSLPQPGLRAVDFDRGGGMEVSAVVPAGATVVVRLDGHQAAEGRADAAGRYRVSLGGSTGVKPGLHQVQLYGDGFTDQVAVQISPAQPLAQGPLHSQLTPVGLRVDWMTPGGGVQSTLLVH
ncbi:hypothetical protein [Phenylobacterium sp.]|uniref:hypothetical protein n=1 Tax=Phenylobacterium sp. TaxID=1871053 RepID=UPI001228E994|nr:hypothetical protein [Phenylobacterium sp.]THD59394.1 MAG: hypothetical protein E8A49_16395 [Phenylobacterium sp.]